MPLLAEEERRERDINASRIEKALDLSHDIKYNNSYGKLNK
jgi:hypothetical protein